MTPEQTNKLLEELHELSPPPLFDGKDYFDSVEQEQEQEFEREQDAECR